jgi:hypothetical protein
MPESAIKWLENSMLYTDHSAFEHEQLSLLPLTIFGKIDTSDVKSLILPTIYGKQRSKPISAEELSRLR